MKTGVFRISCRLCVSAASTVPHEAGTSLVTPDLLATAPILSNVNGTISAAQIVSLQNALRRRAALLNLGERQQRTLTG